MKVDRVFLDTNVLISGLIFREGNEAAVLEKAGLGLVEIVLSTRVISEARNVFADKFPQRAQVLEDFLSGARYEVSPEPGGADLEVAARLVRDPDDVSILASILLTGPDAALTGDKHLLTDEIKAVAPVCRCADYLGQRSEPDD